MAIAPSQQREEQLKAVLHRNLNLQQRFFVQQCCVKNQTPCNVVPATIFRATYVWLGFFKPKFKTFNVLPTLFAINRCYKLPRVTQSLPGYFSKVLAFDNFHFFSLSPRLVQPQYSDWKRHSLTTTATKKIK